MAICEKCGQQYEDCRLCFISERHQSCLQDRECGCENITQPAKASKRAVNMWDGYDVPKPRAQKSYYCEYCGASWVMGCKCPKSSESAETGGYAPAVEKLRKMADEIENYDSYEISMVGYSSAKDMIKSLRKAADMLEKV
jgi:hypothetical protein